MSRGSHSTMPIGFTTLTTPIITCGTTTKSFTTTDGPMKPIATAAETSESFRPRNRKNTGPGATTMAITTAIETTNIAKHPSPSLSGPVP